MTEKVLLGELKTRYDSPRYLYRWPQELYNHSKVRLEQGIKPIVISRETGIPVATIYNWKRRPPKWVSDVFLPGEVDKECLSYLLGVLLGDGYIGGPRWFLRKNYPISLTVKDRDFAEAFSKALSSVLKKPIVVRPVTKKYRKQPWNGFKAQIKDRAFSLWYHALNIPLIETLTMDSPAAFIRGFADSEGHVRKKGNAIRIYNKDEAKLALVKRMLSRMSIDTHFVRGQKEHHTVDHLAIYGESVRRFSEEIGFSIRRKQERLEARP